MFKTTVKYILKNDIMTIFGSFSLFNVFKIVFSLVLTELSHFGLVRTKGDVSYVL